MGRLSQSRGNWSRATKNILWPLERNKSHSYDFFHSLAALKGFRVRNVAKEINFIAI